MLQVLALDKLIPTPSLNFTWGFGMVVHAGPISDILSNHFRSLFQTILRKIKKKETDKSQSEAADGPTTAHNKI